MSYVSKKTHKRTCFEFLNTKFQLDLSNKELVDTITSRAYSFLVNFLREKGNKEAALKVLIKAQTKKSVRDYFEEIIYTYLYFNDFEGGLEYIQLNKNPHISFEYLECFIKIILLVNFGKDSLDELYTLVINGLNVHYYRKFIAIFKEYCIEKRIDKIIIKEKFLLIQDLIEKKYIDNFGYSELHFLYKNMPKKDEILKKMIQCNPLIKKRYYFKYALKNGFNQEDITRMLKAKYRKWLMIIAIKNNWITEELKITILKQFNQLLPYINSGNPSGWYINKNHAHFLDFTSVDKKHRKK